MTWQSSCCSGTSASEAAQADEGAGDAREGEEMFSLAFGAGGLHGLIVLLVTSCLRVAGVSVLLVRAV